MLVWTPPVFDGGEWSTPLVWSRLSLGLRRGKQDLQTTSVPGLTWAGEGVCQCWEWRSQYHSCSAWNRERGYSWRMTIASGDMPLGDPVRGPGMSFPSRELSRELGFGIFTGSPEPKVHLPPRLFTSYHISAGRLTHVLAGKTLEWNRP